jgi:hypothetical protein
MKVNITGLHYIHDVRILHKPRIINDMVSFSSKEAFGSVLALNFIL